MDHEVHAEGERVLEDRRRPAVVDDGEDVGRFRGSGEGGHVEGLDPPARGAFEIEQPGAGKGDGGGSGVAAVHVVHGDAHARQDRAEEAEGVGVDVAHGDNAVAGRDEGEDGGGNRRHALARASSAPSRAASISSSAHRGLMPRL
ncbi:MAG: hypothetical protein U1E40_18005 [Amaricoccus sp.]